MLYLHLKIVSCKVQVPTTAAIHASNKVPREVNYSSIQPNWAFIATSAGCVRIRDPTNYGNTLDSWETLEKYPLYADQMDSKWSVKTVCFWDLGSGLIKHRLTSDTSFWNTILISISLIKFEPAGYLWNWLMNISGYWVSIRQISTV